MKDVLKKIALGGGCHWCTEAVFQSLKGVVSVEQGYIASLVKHSAFSEGVIVHFNANIISLKTLIEIHLYTHKSTSNHSMREKYRSAIYVFSKSQNDKVEVVWHECPGIWWWDKQCRQATPADTPNGQLALSEARSQLERRTSVRALG